MAGPTDATRELYIRVKTTGIQQAEKELQSLGNTATKTQDAIAGSTSTDTPAPKMLKMTEVLDKATRKYDSTARAAFEYSKEATRLNKIAAAFPELQDQVNSTLEKAKKHYDAVANSQGGVQKQAGLARHEMINLSRQAQDIGVSLTSGQSFGTVLIQQGSQIFDIFSATKGTLGGFWEQMKTGASAAFTATRLVVGGLTAVGLAVAYAAQEYDSSQKEIQKSLLGSGKASGLNAGDINKIAQSGADATTMSVGKAREVAMEFVKTGKIYESNVQRLVGVTENFGIVVGQDAVEAAKTLAKALSGDLGKGAEELNERLGFLDHRTLGLIKSLDATGQSQKAISLITDGVAKSTEGATDTLDGYVKVWRAVKAGASSAAEAIGSIFTAEKDSPELLNKLKEQAEALKGMDFSGSDFTSNKFEDRSPEIERVTKALQKYADEIEELRAKQESFKLGNIIDQLVPAVKQVKAFDDALKLLAEHKDNLAITGRLTPEAEGAIGTAVEAGQVGRITAQEGGEKQARANTEALKLHETYKGISLETAKILENQAGTLKVASAVGGAARMQAQEYATVAQLVQQGVKLEEAQAIAAGERAIAQAQINSQAMENLANLRDQFAVNAAVGGQERMQAQNKATYNSLVRQGVSASIAQATADQEQANTQAKINSGAQEQLFALNNQLQVTKAITGEQRIQAQLAATKASLEFSGVSPGIAADVAEAQRANSIAAATTEVERQTKALKQQTEMIQARLEGTEATTAAEQAYSNAVDKGASGAAASALASATEENARMSQMAADSSAEQAQNNNAAADGAEREAKARQEAADAAQRQKEAFVVSGTYEMGKNLWEKDGGYTQFNPSGYQSTSPAYTKADWMAAQTYGQGGYSITQDQFGLDTQGNSQGFTSIANNMLNRYGNPGSYTDAIKAILKDSSTFGGNQVGVIQQLNDLMPEETSADKLAKIDNIQQEISKLREERPSIERDTLIKSLTDQMKTLQSSVDDNTDALNAQLDPLMGQGHDYLNSLKLGYYHAATGLTGIVGGSGGTDSTPVNMMLTPGEKISVTPPGATEENNNNSKTVNQSNTFVFNGISSQKDKRTARQRSQSFISAAARGAMA